MNKIYLISEAYIKSHSNIDDSVDTNIILPAIDTAQEIRLYELIGGKLLLSLKKIAQGEKYNKVLQILLDKYVLPFLNAQVISDIQIPLHYKLKNNGILVNNPDNTTSASMDEVKYLKEYYESQANLYAEKMMEYIRVNKLSREYNVSPQNTYKTSIHFSNRTNVGLGYRW